MFNGKRKALTFSYDDGVLQDERLVDIFNKYNLKGTFNINSELLGCQGSLNVRGTVVGHTKINPEEVEILYAGHEIAVHTLTHPNLTTLEEEEIIQQVEEDRIRLSQLAGYEVYGMAYPCGGVNNDARVAEIIKKNTKVKYARTITPTYSFDLQSNLYRFNPTIHHTEWDKLQEMVQTFIDLETDKPALFYIWGHSYEFDEENTWELFEDICRDLSNRDDIFYGTNKDVLLMGGGKVCL